LKTAKTCSALSIWVLKVRSNDGSKFVKHYCLGLYRVLLLGLSLEIPNREGVDREY
jgi:hypothetical protein